MKVFVCLFAGAALAQDNDLSSLSSAEDSYSYYYDEFGNIPSNITEERGHKKPLIRDDPGSCLICNVEGGDYSAALNECRKKGKFVQCNIDSDPQKKNICELTERRNNAKVYLTSNCNQKQACLGSQGQNKRQCIRFGATDQNGIEKASTCRQCFAIGRSVNSFLKKLESGKYDYSDYNRDFSRY